MKYFRQFLAVLVAWCLFGVQANFAQTISQPPQAAEQSAEQLQQLVAPIALYPDTLVAQILPAATYPEQIVEAAKWMEERKGLQGDQLAKEVDAQPWDPSVKGLTQFPSVLANMKQNLAWTSELGDAYMNQQQDAAQAIQTMRQRAKQAGNLNSTPQEKVKTEGQTEGQTITIEPAQPDIVYVPAYDPWLVYGAPLGVFPGWHPYPGLFLDGPGIDFGLGFGIGFFAGFGWGWHHWDCDWHHDWHHHGWVVHDRHSYISHSTTIVNRNSFHSGRGNFNRGDSSRSFSGRHEPGASRGQPGIQSGAFGGYTHGGIARGDASRGQSSFGGNHGGGFGGGGYHGGGLGGGSFHGGGGRR